LRSRKCSSRNLETRNTEPYDQTGNDGDTDAKRVRNLRIEEPSINGTYTGRPLNLTIRNTEISHVSGDAIQFDPGRRAEPYPWDNVLVDHCFLWTGPLDKDYAGYKQGERPGENAFDSKTHSGEPRKSRITFRNCLLKGWGHGDIGNGRLST